MLRAQAGAAGEEAGRDDSAVVEDEEVAGAQLRGEVLKVCVPVRAGVAVYQEHAAVAALGWWVLRDEFGWEKKVEVGNAHRSDFSESPD